MDQSFGNLGAVGGSSSGGSNFNAPPPPASSSSFLQLPLSRAAAGAAYYGAPLALLHHAAGPSSQYGRHADISPAEVESIKAKTVAHPQYSALLAA